MIIEINNPIIGQLFLTVGKSVIGFLYLNFLKKNIFTILSLIMLFLSVAAVSIIFYKTSIKFLILY